MRTLTRHSQAPRRSGARAGLTLIELIVAFSLLLILSTMALPLMQTRVQREKERRLRDALETMRDAIDRYKDAADAGMLGQLDPDNHGYPESLEVLVEGVEVNSSGAMGPMGQPGMGQGMQPGMGGLQGGMQGGRQGNQQSGMRGQRGFGGQGSSFGNRGGMNSGGMNSGGFNSGSSSSGFGSSSRSGNRSGFGSDRGGRSGFGSEEEDEDKKIRFLRRIPVDPMTGEATWGMRSVSDAPDSMSWSGGNVFDVYSLSMDTALDGTRYNEW